MLFAPHKIRVTAAISPCILGSVEFLSSKEVEELG